MTDLDTIERRRKRRAAFVAVSLMLLSMGLAAAAILPGGPFHAALSRATAGAPSGQTPAN